MQQTLSNPLPARKRISLPRRILQGIRNRPISRLGGDTYSASNVGLLIVGGLGGSIPQAIASVTFIGTGVALQARGENNKCFATVCAVAIPAMVLTNLADMLAGHPAAIAATAIYSVGCAIGTANEFLTREFKESKNDILRKTLGNPRGFASSFWMGSKVFMVASAIATHNWGLLGVVAGWGLGDVLTMISSRAKKNAEGKLEADRPGANPDAPKYQTLTA